MIEFIRGILVTCFKSLGYIVFSGFIAAFIAGTFTSQGSFWTVFFCTWAITGIVMFTFPNLLEKEV